MPTNTRKTTALQNFPCPILVCVQTPDVKFLLDDPKNFTVGREYSSYVIKDETVAKRQCTFFLQEEKKKWAVSLERYATSSFLNGKPMLRKTVYYLKTGDVLQFGPVQENSFVFWTKRSIYEKKLEIEARKKQLQEGVTKEKNEELTQCKKCVKEMEQKLEKRDEKIKSLKTTTKVKDNINKEKDDKISTLELRNSEKVVRISTLQSDNNKKAVKIATLEKENREKVEKIATLEAENEDCFRNLQMKESEIVELKYENKEKGKIIRVLREKDKESRIKISALEKKSDEYVTAINVLKKDCEHWKGEGKRALDQNEMIAKKATQQIKRLKQDVALKEDTINSLTNFIETEFECSICNNVFYRAVSGQCGHLFCVACIQKWEESNRKCPLCNVIGSFSNPAPNVNSFLEKSAPLLSEEFRMTRKELIEERGGSQAEIDELNFFVIEDDDDSEDLYFH